MPKPVDHARGSLHRFARALLRADDHVARFWVLRGRLLIVWDTQRPAPQPVPMDEAITANRRRAPEGCKDE